MAKCFWQCPAPGVVLHNVLWAHSRQQAQRSGHRQPPRQVLGALPQELGPRTLTKAMACDWGPQLKGRLGPGYTGGGRAWTWVAD